MIQLAESRGDRAKADQLRAYAARGKGKSKFDIAMRMLNQDHGGNIDQYALSGGNLFGLNMSQFARMSKLWSDTGGMPDLGSRLKQAGLDETKMSTSQQMSLAQQVRHHRRSGSGHAGQSGEDEQCHPTAC